MQIKCPKCRYKFDTMVSPDCEVANVVCGRCGNHFMIEVPQSLSIPSTTSPEPASEQTVVTKAPTNEEVSKPSPTVTQQQTEAINKPIVRRAIKEKTGKTHILILAFIAIALIAGITAFWYTNMHEKEKLDAIGSLTAFYAKENIKCTDERGWGYAIEFAAGELIGDTNFSGLTIGSNNDSTFCIGNPVDGLYEFPKSKVEVITYTISHLPVKLVGQSAKFMSKDGLVARIFKSSNNGHHFRDSNGAIEDEYMRPEGCYVISVQWRYEDTTSFIEDELKTKDGNFECTLVYDDMWAFDENYQMSDKSNYDGNGNLLTDLQGTPSPPEYSIAYIGDQDALYFSGKLYYRQK